MDPRRSTRTYRWFHFLLKNTLGRFLIWRYRIQTTGLERLEQEPGPWLVLPNHVTTWDPFLVSVFLKDPVYFIASDANFRKAFVSWWLRRVGAIPTSKQATDMTTLKQMIQLIRGGKTVGLFPEGERTWDGVTLPIIPATAKLARLAGVAVIVPVIKGGFFALPRWTFASRRGPIHIDYRVAVGAAQIRSLSLSRIQERIESAIRHDDHLWLRENTHRYHSRRPAEPLQLCLHCCPHCGAFNSLEGKHDIFFCRGCGWSTRYGSNGLFTPVQGAAGAEPSPHYFDNIRQWALWQQERLKEAVSILVAQSNGSELFSDSQVSYATGFKFASLQDRGQGRLSLEARGVRFSTVPTIPPGQAPVPHQAPAPHPAVRTDQAVRTNPVESKGILFPLEEIRAVNVVYQSQLEFYFRGTLHVFRFPDRKTSGYKYLEALRLMVEEVKRIE